jgi:hypothetical protein
MASNYCADCGCRTSNGICSNCQEELYILEFQSEWIDGPLSDEFMTTAREQRKYLETTNGTETTTREDLDIPRQMGT